MLGLNLLVALASSVGGKFVNTYDPAIIKDWLNSYPYLYKGFTPNKGQLATMDGKVAKDVIFYSRNGNMGIFITENGLSYVIYDIEKKEASKDEKLPLNIEKKPENSILHYARIDYELINAKIKKENIIYQDELPGYENFYLAHCPDGILFVKSYRKVIIKDVYPGINWIFRYDDNGNFHHEFELKEPDLISQIKLKVKYADIELVDNGKSIILSTPIGKIKDGNLIGYQGNNIVEVSYRLKENDLLTFEAIDYDKNKSLLIDPYALIWSTYYGGSNNDRAFSISTDAQGNIFVVGRTNSPNFPTYNPASSAYFDGTCGTDGNCNYDGTDYYNDILILKFNNSGVREWATYYGGSNDECGFFYSCYLTADDNGNVYITGWTLSTDFPTQNLSGAYNQPYGGAGDAFILKFDNSGIRLWATYYGGGSEDGGYAIVYSRKSLYVIGITVSSDFPTYDPQNGAYYQGSLAGIWDAFILKFSDTGQRIWATYYGGSSEDYAYSITIDSGGNVFITGRTTSSDFPVYNPGTGAYYQGTCGGCPNYNDAFILKFNPIGIRLWATYYGGTSGDRGFSITTDKQGNVYVTGATKSTDFPTQNPGGNTYYQGNYGGGNYDAFILKFDNWGQRLWATYYGGSDIDAGFSIITDNQNNVFVTGYTWSNDLPTQPLSGAYYQQNNAGNYDAFILKFNNSGSLLWATYYGGSNGDYGSSIAADGQDNVFITGLTTSTNFPTQNPGNNAYYQASNAGSEDGFIAKFGSPNNIFETSNKSTFFKVYKNILIFYVLNKPSYIEITIYNANGSLNRIIKYGYVQIGKYEIGLNSLPKGVYIVNVKIDNNSNWIKFIKN